METVVSIMVAREIIRGDAENQFRNSNKSTMTTTLFHGGNGRKGSTPSKRLEVRKQDFRANGFLDPDSEAGN